MWGEMRYETTSDKNKHMIAAAISLKDDVLLCWINFCRVWSAVHCASKTSEIGTRLLKPRARIDTPKALMAELRYSFSFLPAKSGSTSTQAPQIRDWERAGSLDKRWSSFAGTKFWAQSEITSQRGQLSGHATEWVLLCGTMALVCFFIFSCLVL